MVGIQQKFSDVYPTIYMKQTGNLSLNSHQESMKNPTPLYGSSICLKGLHA